MISLLCTSVIKTQCELFNNSSYSNNSSINSYLVSVNQYVTETLLEPPAA